MPTYEISIINEEFASTSEHECESPVSAREQAIKSALAIGSEQVSAGKPYFGAHVILREGNKELIQFVVSAGASPLKSDAE